MTLLFFYTPIGLALWIVVAMWHLRRRHQIREKSSLLYYGLLVIDGIGYIADVLANYTWFSVFLLDCPRLDRREITISQHMKRIRKTIGKRKGYLSAGEVWSLAVSDFICKRLNKLEDINDNGERKIHC